MGTKKKKFEDLTICDDFLFGTVMLDEVLCRRMIELAVGFPIERVFVVREKSMQFHPEYHGIRLDVYARDGENTHYDVEMQVRRENFLKKRTRYYHDQMDMELLESGVSYEELPDCYVIFICCFDPFGEGGIDIPYLITAGKQNTLQKMVLGRSICQRKDAILQMSRRN